MPPLAEMSLENEADGQEVTGIMDYPSDEAAAETSKLEHGLIKADLQFNNGMEELIKLGKKRRDDTEELLEEYFIQRRIVESQGPYVPLSEAEMKAELAEPDLGEDQPPEMAPSDDEASEHDSDEDNMDDEFETDSDNDDKSGILDDPKHQVLNS